MSLLEILTCPPTDGSVLLPDTLPFHKKHNADVPMYLFMEDGADDVTQITYGHFERACRRVSRVTGTNAESATSPVVAVIALADTLVYQTIVVGVMAAGFIVRGSFSMLNTITYGGAAIPYLSAKHSPSHS